ncbi:hypothetical protein [Morganella morganii IS15]|nr:hypothetical protein [Morganella morganii IS15]
MCISGLRQRKSVIQDDFIPLHCKNQDLRLKQEHINTEDYII